jgi:hypothetical protein
MGNINYRSILKQLSFLSRALNSIDSTKRYDCRIEDGVEYITIQVFNNSTVVAYLSIEDAIKLVEEKLLQLGGAKELYKKFKKARG